jgi:CBS domain-containing protein
MKDGEGPGSIEPIPLRNLMRVKVRDIMNKMPPTISPKASIDDLLEYMRREIENCFLVVDEDQKLLGIVTESDIFQIFYPGIPRATIGSVFREIAKTKARTVGEIMTKRPITATPEMRVTDALKLMAEHKLRRLPVVEGGKLVGLLSLRDIVELYRLLR